MTAPHPEAALSAREAEKTAAALSAYEAAYGATLDQKLGSWVPHRVAHAAGIDAVLALSTAHTATAGDGWVREAATRLLNACISDFGLGDDDDDDSAVGGGATPADDMAITFGHLRGLQAALAQAPAVQAPAGEDVARAKAITQACFDPGLLAGPRGDRTVDGWRADAVLSVLGALAASPTPTDAQPKAARPVGEVDTYSTKRQRDKLAALVGNDDSGETLARVITDADVLHELIAAGRIGPAHPTTGQETVATPRGGGVREALRPFAEKARQWEGTGLEDHREIAVTFPVSVYRKALAALSAPRSAGPGEPVGALHVVFDGLPGPEGGRFVEVETSDGESVDAGEWYGPRADGLYELRIPRALATPSPAQEPGTGDTGEVLTRQDWFKCEFAASQLRRLDMEQTADAVMKAARIADAVAFHKSIADLRAKSATPATTAETRGPAEGAR
jgi:hypothetical protein